MTTPTALFRAYPALGEMLDALCAGRTWCLTGVSALLHDGARDYWEITKPKHWQRLPDGRVQVGIGAIGGSLEEGEGVLECLEREVAEEVGARVVVEPARESLFVYEESRVEAAAPPPAAGYPLPALFTVSRNLHRQSVLPECEVLAIVTFGARLAEEPSLGDLYGLLGVPRALRDEVLRHPPPAGDLQRLPGVTLETRTALPPDTVLAPVWTARSIQVLAQQGRPLPQDGAA
jgi:hypothetical protein